MLKTSSATHVKIVNLPKCLVTTELFLKAKKSHPTIHVTPVKAEIKNYYILNIP